MDNTENQYYDLLCTNYCYRNISSDISPPCCSVPIPILVKHAILVADILADPIIGTALHKVIPTFEVDFFQKKTRVGYIPQMN